MNIRSRHVFYIPGYEPRGPRFYEKLYLKHIRRFCRLHSVELDLKPTETTKLRRRTEALLSGKESSERLTYDILDNADVLQPHSNIPRWKFYLLLIFYTPKALRSVFKPTCKSVDHAWLMFLVSWIFFYLGVLCTLFGYFGTNWLLRAFGLIPSLAVGASITVSLTIWLWFEYQYRRQNIARIFNSGRFFLDGNDPVQKHMSNRLDEFAELIQSEIQKYESDEYLIVGHSSGSVLAARVAARLADTASMQDKKITLVCMGSVYQLELSGQTHFNAQKDVYQKLRDTKILNWIEVFSAFDAFCPQRMDPCNSHLRPTKKSHKPLFRSANFKKNLNPDKFQKLKRNLLWIHMQYILSSDYAITFDYFKMITGLTPAFQYLSNPERHD